MLLNLTDNFLRAGTTVSTEAPDMNAERPHHLEETPVSVCLHEAHVRIAVTVLKIDYQPADGEHARAVAVKALVATQHSVRGKKIVVR